MKNYVIIGNGIDDVIDGDLRLLAVDPDLVLEGFHRQRKGDAVAVGDISAYIVPSL